MRKNVRGFTIVELLIVIVVIAILAAISVVAYNGIQSRARNTQQLSTAKSYMDALASYVAINGSYPSTGGVTRVCLGIEQADCTTSTAWYRNATIETALKSIISPLPQASTGTPNTVSPKMAYVPASDITLDGVINPFLIYTIEAPGTCTAGTPVSGVWPNYTSAVPAQGYTFTEAGGIRVCTIALPRI